MLRDILDGGQIPSCRSLRENCWQALAFLEHQIFVSPTELLVPGGRAMAWMCPSLLDAALRWHGPCCLLGAGSRSRMPEVFSLKLNPLMNRGLRDGGLVFLPSSAKRQGLIHAASWGAGWELRRTGADGRDHESLPGVLCPATALLWQRDFCHCCKSLDSFCILGSCFVLI